LPLSPNVLLEYKYSEKHVQCRLSFRLLLHFKKIEEAREFAGICTDERCQATEHVIDELNNALFSISKPRWSDADCSIRIKQLKCRMYVIYVNYRGVFENRNRKAAG